MRKLFVIAVLMLVMGASACGRDTAGDAPHTPDAGDFDAELPWEEPAPEPTDDVPDLPVDDEPQSPPDEPLTVDREDWHDDYREHEPDEYAELPDAPEYDYADIAEDESNDETPLAAYADAPEDIHTHLEIVRGADEYSTARQALNAYNLIRSLLMPAAGGFDVYLRISAGVTMLGMNMNFESGGRVRMAHVGDETHVRVQMDLASMGMGEVDERFILGQIGTMPEDAGELFEALFALPPLAIGDIIRAHELALGDTHSYLFVISAEPFVELVGDLIPTQMPDGIFDMPAFDDLPLSNVDILVVFNGGYLAHIEMSFSVDAELLGTTISASLGVEYEFRAFGDAVDIEN